MEKLNNCPVCNGPIIEDLFQCKDYVASGEYFSISQCESCNLKFTNPRPTEDEIGKYYQSDKYISHSGNEKQSLGLMYKIYDIVRNYSIKSKLSLIKKYHTAGNLLDLGCGMGYFANGVKKDGTFNLMAADVSTEAIEYVKKTFNINVLNETSLDQIESDSIDIITQWHVIEHVHRIEERLQFLKRVLKHTGSMFIAVPINESFDAQYYKEYWDGYDVPRHLLHFSRNSMEVLLDKYDFKIEKQIPLYFDAPYISMRSEVHKQHKLSMLRGGIIGSISNISAMISGKYSTILFIVKHK